MFNLAEEFGFKGRATIVDLVHKGLAAWQHHVENVKLDVKTFESFDCLASADLCRFLVAAMCCVWNHGAPSHQVPTPRL